MKHCKDFEFDVDLSPVIEFNAGDFKHSNLNLLSIIMVIIGEIDEGATYQKFADDWIYVPNIENEDEIDRIIWGDALLGIGFVFNKEHENTWKCPVCEEGYRWVDPTEDTLGHCSPCNATFDHCTECTNDHQKCL